EASGWSPMKSSSGRAAPTACTTASATGRRPGDGRRSGSLHRVDIYETDLVPMFWGAKKPVNDAHGSVVISGMLTERIVRDEEHSPADMGSDPRAGKGVRP